MTGMRFSERAVDSISLNISSVFGPEVCIIGSLRFFEGVQRSAEANATVRDRMAKTVQKFVKQIL